MVALGPRIAALCFAAAFAAAAFTCEPLEAADPAPVRLHVEHRGALSLPEERGRASDGRPRLTGLSGITWLGGDRYAAAIDNSAGMVRFRLELAADGTPRSCAELELITLAERHDFEDIAPRLGSPPAVFLCEEDTPAIRVFRLADGVAEGTIPLPAVTRFRRANRGLEALALDPDGKYLWTANEEALVPDGEAASMGVGTVVRLMRLPLGAGGPPFQVAYRVDPPHDFVPVFPGPTFSGLVALVALGQGRLLALERSAGPGLPPFESRLYAIDTTNAADVSGIGGDLGRRGEIVIDKTLVWSGALGLNLEGLCLGPRLQRAGLRDEGPQSPGLPGGRRALVGISDNGGLSTPTQVVGFELSAVTSP